MKKIQLLILSALVMAVSCKKETHSGADQQSDEILIKENGTRLEFRDSSMSKSFKAEHPNLSNVQAELRVPARVIATIVKSVENSEQNLVLFDNPDLTANYTAFLQHIININTYKVNLARIKDLADNGAATGKEVIEAETQLANERAAIIEDEAKLKLAGLDPEQLIKARLNSVWVICDIPETQIDNLQSTGTCKIYFSSFPHEVFVGNIEELGEVVDPITRMVKLRVSVPNPVRALKAGMFATVQLGVKNGKYFTLSRNALVNVQGKNFVFVKSSPTVIERREVMIGDQIENQVIVFSGIAEKDLVVTIGAMQLKGLSFGY